jgi:hypothetical protein
VCWLPLLPTCQLHASIVSSTKSRAKVAGQSRGPKSRAKVAGQSRGPKSRAKVASQSRGPKSRAKVAGQSRGPKKRAKEAGQSHRPKSLAKVTGQSRRPKSIGLILCYKATFLSMQTYFPSDEVTQSVQKPIFWSDAAIQYLKVQGTKVLVAHFSNYSLTLCNL